MAGNYETDGYFVLKGFYQEAELQILREIALSFHESWKQANAAIYAARAINSAYLTGQQHLQPRDREVLFKLIASTKLMDVVTSVMGDSPAFMNTQLFFDPVNRAQRNYWHRDPQYHLSLEEQKQLALLGPNVVHFRVPLFDEPGIEVIPETHKRWDSEEELDVRLERKGRRNFEDLATGVTVKLSAGDLMGFSANMIHRGIYGMDRLALDILFCDPKAKLMSHLDISCLPDAAIIKGLESPGAFERTLALKALEQD